MTMTTWLLISVLSAPAVAAPASDASFSAALTAGKAPMITSAIAALRNEVDTLLELLRDRDPAVRRQAVRSLKAWVSQRSSTRDRVLDVFESSSEDLSVRREAAKTLSVTAGDSKIYRALLDQGNRGSDVGLRAVSYKSLYWIASQRSDVRNDLLDAARRESNQTVRLAAIWALFVASNDNRVQDVLKDIARRDHNQDARVEALKSLYGGMGSNDVRDLTYDLARNTNENAEVRRTAILMQSNRTTSRQEDLLEEIATRDREPLMRAAAITALGSAVSSEITTHFHLIRRNRNGVPVNDPLDAE